jgi:glycine/D-amino acid oxidase-like deaminating enzyme
VLLIDSRDFCHGSTAASTGLLQYEVDTPLVELIQKVGETHAVHAYRRGLAAIDEIERLVAELGDPCGFTRRDSLYFASRFWHHRRLKNEYDCRRQYGFDVSFLSKRQLVDISSIKAAGAIRSRGDAQIDPFRFARTLIRVAVQNGLRAHAHTQVVEIDEQANPVAAKTNNGTIHADRIVYATGYESEQYLSETKGYLDTTYAVVSEPWLNVPGWPDRCLIWETARPYFYARWTDDRRTMIGGEDSAFPSDHNREKLVARKIDRLVARFHRLFPGAEFTPEYSWAGTFAGTKDGLAFIGQPVDRPRAYFALGYGGNGITFSVIAAQLIADLHAGRPNPDAAVFRFGR